MNAEERLYEKIWSHKIATKDDLSVEGNLRVGVALKHINGGDTLLDIGCGEGTLGSAVMNKYREVHGVDISPQAIELANKAGIIASRININEEPLSYPEKTFDTVTALDVIEHVFDPCTFIQEIHRVLKVGGDLVISTPNIRKLQRMYSLLRGHFPRTSYDEVGWDGGHLHYFTSSDLAQLLVQFGFQILVIDGVCGDRRSWKYVTVVTLLGERFEKEFLSSAFVIKAQKV